MSGYTPIEEYGLIGDEETCALVSRRGSIDWFPAPHVESPGVFASLLDADRGGRFSIRPLAPFEATHEYIERTNVLRTTFRTDSGTCVLTDFMPAGGDDTEDSHDTGGPDSSDDSDDSRGSGNSDSGDVGDSDSVDTASSSVGSGSQRAIYRKVECVAGEVDLGVEFAPRPDFARAEAAIEAVEGGLLARAEDEALLLAASPAFDVEADTATARVTLPAGDQAWFVLGYREVGADESGGSTDATSSAESVDPADSSDLSNAADADGRGVVADFAASLVPERRLSETIRYWREWTHDCDDRDCVFDGPWHDLTTRSGLVLKLLAHRESGAIAAAPTTSLPEEIGGERNWDYRFSWLRDGAFTVQALSNLGHREEAWAFFTWFRGLCHTDPADLQPLYGLHGEVDLDEETLEHLSGYRGSNPVRVGNAARDQRQLDIFGELLVAIHETTDGGTELDAGEWSAIRAVVEHVREVWDQPDEGIWEVRCEPKQFVFSKVMCWAALDRGIDMAETREFDAPLCEWRETRTEIREVVLERGFDEEIGEHGSFTRTLDGDELDATGLLLPIVGFLPFDDRRVSGTIDATLTHLTGEDGLVYRYNGEDGLEGEEGAFVLCSFWLVDALTLSGRIEEARELFETLLSYASPLGLLAEEVDPDTGAHLGNFPQAFSHIGLINSALYLGRALGREGVGPDPMGFDDAIEAE